MEEPRIDRSALEQWLEAGGYAYLRKVAAAVAIEQLKRKDRKYPEDLEDLIGVLVQDALALAVSQWGSFNPEKASLKTWMGLKVRSAFKNYMRDNKNELWINRNKELSNRKDGDTKPGTPVDPDELLGPDEPLEKVPVKMDVQAALSKLPPRQRQVATLAYIHGMKVSEIAKATGLHHKTVQESLAKATERLRKLLDDYRPAGAEERTHHRRVA